MQLIGIKVMEVTGEVGEDRSYGEEAVAVDVVTGCHLGEEGVDDLSLHTAAVAGDVAHVLAEERT